MIDKESIQNPVSRLLEKGVVIPNPHSVEVDEAVDPGQIADGVTIHAGSKIMGKSLSIGPGSVIGYEGPATVEDCQLGHGVSLGSGFFSGATFLDGSSMGGGAHIRSGTILEEEASGAHTVGLKQTILFPFVTAGSLINFCDCLMAGGTSRRNHSEIGSSYIHFNFTPHGDKATASLIGEVPRGVFMRERPIFLGGQGGIIGPTRIGYGVLIPAGAILRKDALEENCMHPGSNPPAEGSPRPYTMKQYQSIYRIVRNNLIYIGNIRALREWYLHVRKLFMSVDPWRMACWEGAIFRLDQIHRERVKRLGQLAENMGISLDIAGERPGVDLSKEPFRGQRRFLEQWPDMEARLSGEISREAVERCKRFLDAISCTDDSVGYTRAIQSLDDTATADGRAWLQAVVDTTVAIWHSERPL